MQLDQGDRDGNCEKGHFGQEIDVREEVVVDRVEEVHGVQEVDRVEEDNGVEEDHQRQEDPGQEVDDGVEEVDHREEDHRAQVHAREEVDDARFDRGQEIDCNEEVDDGIEEVVDLGEEDRCDEVGGGAAGNAAYLREEGIEQVRYGIVDVIVDSLCAVGPGENRFESSGGMAVPDRQ